MLFSLAFADGTKIARERGTPNDVVLGIRTIVVAADAICREQYITVSSVIKTSLLCPDPHSQCVTQKGNSTPHVTKPASVNVANRAITLVDSVCFIIEAPWTPTVSSN